MWNSAKNWGQIQKEDDKEIRRIEKARRRYERREDKKDQKELKRYEKVLNRGLRL